MLAASDVDWLDPGRTAYQMGIMVAQATQRSLYRFAPDDLSKMLPDLAASAPRVSADGRTVTVKLRSGVRFSPPVRRAVTSADVAYAFDRMFSANVAAPYASYFSGLEGAPATPTKGVRAVSGISTPDARTIVFRLKPHSAPAFVGALVLPVTAPVPREYAKPFDAKTSSTYSEHVVATGPYMVKNDAAGKVTGYAPGKTIELVRNPSWSRATDARPALLDSVRIRTDATDSSVAARQVLAGHDMVLADPPPSAILKQVSKRPKGVVSQTLVPRATGTGRVIATEVLITTPAIANLIREGKAHQITSAMQAGRALGMHTMDQNLADLVNEGEITREQGFEKAHDPDSLERLIRREDMSGSDLTFDPSAFTMPEQIGRY